MSEPDWSVVGEDSIEQLRALLRFETVNPPGDEGPCAEYAAERLRHPRITLARHDSGARPNLVARLAGTGARPPLLLTGHLDVVPVERARWSVDPFAAEVRGEHLYGRGALDMKCMVSMCLTVMRQLAALPEGTLQRDVICALVSDEEAGCTHGSRFLVEQHPEAVRAECMIGEFGGFSTTVRGRRVYPIQIAEKGIAEIRLVARGRPGHGSVPHREMAVGALARAIDRLLSTDLPVHPIDASRAFLAALARTQPAPIRPILRGLGRPRWSNALRRHFIRDVARSDTFRAMLCNTVSPTLLDASSTAINVIPGEAAVRCDGRLIPGQTGEDLVRELRTVLSGLPIEVELVRWAPGRANDAGGPLYDLMAAAVRDADPEGEPVPYLMPGYTDAAWFGRLGMQCYGFCPLRLPAEESFWEGVHGHDERLHLPAYRWGLPVLYRVVREWCSA